MSNFRSSRSDGGEDQDGFFHRSRMNSHLVPADIFAGRPVIGICNTWSELTPCQKLQQRLVAWQNKRELH